MEGLSVFFARIRASLFWFWIRRNSWIFMTFAVQLRTLTNAVNPSFHQSYHFPNTRHSSLTHESFSHKSSIHSFVSNYFLPWQLEAMAGSRGFINTKKSDTSWHYTYQPEIGLHVIVMRDIEAWKHDTRRSKWNMVLLDLIRTEQIQGRFVWHRFFHVAAITLWCYLRDTTSFLPICVLFAA